MSYVSIDAVRCAALFVSPLQRSECPSPGQVREAVRHAVGELGSRGCAGGMAQEFGDHPEVAVPRMRWARQVVDSVFGGARAAHHRAPVVRLAVAGRSIPAARGAA